MFHRYIWIIFVFGNWMFDFCRTALFYTGRWSLTNKLHALDILQLIHVIITPICLLKLIERGPSKKYSAVLAYIAVTMLTIGSTTLLVRDSILHRLEDLGYNSLISLRENPIMQRLQPNELVGVFELLLQIHSQIGHNLWNFSFFLSVFICFWVFCENEKNVEEATNKQDSAWTFLLPFNSLYLWYMVTQYEAICTFIFTYAVMMYIGFRTKPLSKNMDTNGQFILQSFTVTLILIILWVAFLWNNEPLRLRYKGYVYVPQPWTYYVQVSTPVN